MWMFKEIRHDPQVAIATAREKLRDVEGCRLRQVLGAGEAAQDASTDCQDLWRRGREVADRCPDGRQREGEAQEQRRPGILPVFENRQINEITTDGRRALCNKVKACSVPVTTVYIRTSWSRSMPSSSCAAEGSRLIAAGDPAHGVADRIDGDPSGWRCA